MDHGDLSWVVLRMAGKGPADGVARKKTTFGEDIFLINNRQGGRRRGRGGGGGGPRQPNGSPSPGNRQDNRQRGNAAQLHEKYRSMARDAQMGGDRVQTEYYLQFADHYYRVLNEGRSRFEEQRRQRDDFGYDEEEGEDELAAGESGERDEPSDGNGQSERPFREDRDDRGPRRARPDREERNGEYRGRRPQRSRDDDQGEEGEERISLDSLPPAIAVLPTADAGDDDSKPRRRGRRPRDDDDADIAPAA